MDVFHKHQRNDSVCLVFGKLLLIDSVFSVLKVNYYVIVVAGPMLLLLAAAAVAPNLADSL